MQIKDYVCADCSGTDFILKAKNEKTVGIYCSKCGRWYKWADKKEKNLLPQNNLQSQETPKMTTLPVKEKMCLDMILDEVMLSCGIERYQAVDLILTEQIKLKVN